MAKEKVYKGPNINKPFLLFEGKQGSFNKTFNPSIRGCNIPMGAPVIAGPVRLCIKAKKCLSVKLKYAADKIIENIPMYNSIKTKKGT